MIFTPGINADKHCVDLKGGRMVTTILRAISFARCSATAVDAISATLLTMVQTRKDSVMG